MNLLKKLLGQQEKETETLLVVQPKKYSSEIEEVHDEFRSAADKLVMEANKIIKEANDKNPQKIELLKTLGFTQALEVRSAEGIIEKAKDSEKQISLIKEYQKKYPLNKFITEDQVKEICGKYNLVCGDIKYYLGFVPEENLKRISQFRLKQEDKYLIDKEIYVILNNWSLLNIKDIRKNGYKIFDNNAIDRLPTSSNITKKVGGYVYLGDKTYDNSTNIPGWGKTFQYHENTPISSYGDHDIIQALRRNSNSFKICAPRKDMDINNMRIENGYQVQENYKDVPDPVVLQPVFGGYLIVDAWGDEASDPIVVNQINN